MTLSPNTPLTAENADRSIAKEPDGAMKHPMTVENTLRSANAARQQEWDQDDQITASYRGNELAGEVGEACNVIKKLERERLGISGSRATVGDLAEELADVVICADLIALHYRIDLDAAVIAKFNKTSEKVGLSTRLAGATPDAAQARMERLEYRIAEAYQVIGAIADAGGLFNHPDVQRALTYFSEAEPEDEILPFSLAAQESEGA